ncbi:MAG: hypothetical protein V4692_07995 [Bdellovibrionota bacterium]
MARFNVLAVLAFSAAVAPQVHAETAQIKPSEKIATYENPLCKDKSNIADMSDKGFMISENSIQYKGQCVNSKKFRPLILRDQLPGALVVDNFFHREKFWRATIPTSATSFKKAYFQIIRFPVVEGVIAAHGQLRFVLSDDVSLKLESQDGGTMTIKGAQAPNSIIWSVEAAFPEKVAYNFAEGAVDNYPIVARVGSAQQRMSESTNPIEQHVLQLDKDPVKNSALLGKLAEAAIRKSDSLGMKSFYNTIRPNCVSEAFDLIDAVRKVKGVRPFYTVLWVDPVAGPAIRALKERGIYGDRSLDLQQEFSPMVGKSTPPPLTPKSGAIRTMDDKPFTLVTLIPKSGQSAAVVELIQKETDKTLSQAIPRLTSAAIIPSMISGGSAGAIGGVVKYVQSEIGAMIDRIDPKLPSDQAVTVISYLTPWAYDKNAQRASLVQYNIPADLPFDYLRETDAPGERVAEVLKVARDNMMLLQAREYTKFRIYSLKEMADAKKAGKKLVNPKPAFLMGLIVRLRLQHGRSVSTVQAVMSMVPQDLPFATAATVDMDRIHISRAFKQDIEKMGAVKAPKSTMIITHVQNHNDYLTPEINVEFGALQPFHDIQGNANFGLAKVAQKPLIGCGDSYGLIPEMRGVFFPDALGNKPGWNLKDVNSIGTQLMSNIGDGVENYIKDKEVGLGIYSLKFVKALEYCYSLPHGSKEKVKFCDKKALSKSGYMIWDMDIGVRSLAFQCTRLSMVNDQVTNEGNMTVDAMLVDAFKKSEKLATDTIMGAAGPNAALLKSTVEAAQKLRKTK